MPLLTFTDYIPGFALLSHPCVQVTNDLGCQSPCRSVPLMTVSLAVAAERLTPALHLRPWQTADMPDLLAAMDQEYPARGLWSHPEVEADALAAGPGRAMNMRPPSGCPPAVRRKCKGGSGGLVLLDAEPYCRRISGSAARSRRSPALAPRPAPAARKWPGRRSAGSAPVPGCTARSPPPVRSAITRPPMTAIPVSARRESALSPCRIQSRIWPTPSARLPASGLPATMPSTCCCCAVSVSNPATCSSDNPRKGTLPAASPAFGRRRITLPALPMGSRNPPGLPRICR